MELFVGKRRYTRLFFAKRLKAKYANKMIEVITLGVMGYSAVDAQSSDP
jgi:hypothetical protein